MEQYFSTYAYQGCTRPINGVPQHLSCDESNNAGICLPTPEQQQYCQEPQDATISCCRNKKRMSCCEGPKTDKKEAAEDRKKRMERQRKLIHEILSNITTTNGLFSAVMIVSITGSITPSSGIPANCVAGGDITHRLVICEIISFGLYIMSGLSAVMAKIKVARLEVTDPEGDEDIKNHPRPNRGGTGKKGVKNPPHYIKYLVLISVALSGIATGILLLSFIDVLQVKVGLLSCGDTGLVVSAVVLVTGVAMGIYCYVKVIFDTMHAYTIILGALGTNNRDGNV